MAQSLNGLRTADHDFEEILSQAETILPLVVVSGCTSDAMVGCRALLISHRSQPIVRLFDSIFLCTEGMRARHEVM